MTEPVPKSDRAQYRFVPEGTVVREVEADSFYVDVGSIEHPGVFDHHAGQAGKEGAPASAIWSAREAARERARGLERVTIITHEHPDWNGCWGVTLLKWVIEKRELEEARIQALNTYSKFVLSGFNPSDGPVEKSPLAIFETLMADVEMETAQSDAALRDRRKIETSEAFFEHCYRSISSYDDLKTGSFLMEDGPYGRAMLLVRDDFQVYLHDLQRARRFTAVVKRRFWRDAGCRRPEASKAVLAPVQVLGAQRPRA